MAESAKDLSTTALGLIAAYVLPGALVVGVVAWDQPCIQHFLLEDAEHFTLAAAAALTIGLLLNGLRLAVLSRWLFREMSYRDSDFEDIEQGRFSELQAAIDEVFRLHQFCCALYFLVSIGLIWLAVQTRKVGLAGLTSEYRQIPLWEWLLLSFVTWRVLARATLETYEFYHQIATGILRKLLPEGPSKWKARLIAVLFSMSYWSRYERVSILPPFGKVGDTIVFVGQGFTDTDTVSFGATAAPAPIRRSDKYLTVTVPNGATTGPVTVTRPAQAGIQGRTLTSKKQFRVTPQITSFNPPHGSAGTLVTITGVSLAQTTGVKFGRVKAIPNPVSDTAVNVDAPSSAATSRIVITTRGGTATSANDFTVP